jgi:hypothetical protein
MNKGISETVNTKMYAVYVKLPLRGVPIAFFFVKVENMNAIENCTFLTRSRS